MEQLTELAYDYDITFVVPCLNEERHVRGALEHIREAVALVGCSAEIVVMDDGSKDQTSERVREFQRDHPEIPLRLFRRERTMGLARNYVDGAFVGRGKYYKQVGGDDAEPVEIIAAVISRLGEADMILPYLEPDNRDLFRRVLSRAFTKLINAVSGNHLRYYNGTAAHLRYNIMRWHSDTYGFAFQAEVITRLLFEGATYLEVRVEPVEQEGRRSRALQFHNVLSVLHSILQITMRRVRFFLFRV